MILIEKDFNQNFDCKLFIADYIVWVGIVVRMS